MSAFFPAMLTAKAQGVYFVLSPAPFLKYIPHQTLKNKEIGDQGSLQEHIRTQQTSDLKTISAPALCTPFPLFNMPNTLILSLGE